MQVPPIAVRGFHNKIYSFGYHLLLAGVGPGTRIEKQDENSFRTAVISTYRNIYKILILNLKFDKKEYIFKIYIYLN